ncbi:hypothetical protein ACIQU1_28820 [Streptomyces angustmyceticus]|uniref:hypothetical protein n=1 Tax=Streptomyces angustmyceticus TaxID=285578 RepID=UPI003814E16E
MMNSVPVPRRAARRTAGRAAILAAAMLVAAPLVGTATPAVAADGQTIDDTKTYGSEADILAAMEKWSPVESAESVMGYPKGIRDEKGNITSVDLADVMQKYDPQQAVADAKVAAKKYADDPNTKKFLGDAARQIADTTLTEPETRQNTLDDNIWPDGQRNPAPNYCEGRVGSDGTLNTAGASPCMFIGKLDTAPDSKYPKAGASTGIAGGGKKTYKVSQQLTDEKSDMAGWSVGGKVSGKVTSTPANGGAGGEAGPEFSFTYSYSSTSTKRNMQQVDDQTEVEFPSDKKGSLQGRRDGAYYVGYIVVDSVGDPASSAANKERLFAIPARVFVQSPQSSTPVTYFKYQES